jgi:hypothetical protein
VQGEEGGATTQSSDAGLVADSAVPPVASPEAGRVDDAASPIDAPSGGDEYEAGADASIDAGTTAPATVTVDVEFFDWSDNSPAGNEIAYPRSGGYPTLHEFASGTGTHADPITFGGDSTVFPPGTIVYVPFLEKYVILEDECLSCAMQAGMTNHPAISIWMPSDATTPAGPLAKCETFWTKSSVAVIENPPADLTVSSAPLFDPTTKTCRTSP